MNKHKSFGFFRFLTENRKTENRNRNFSVSVPKFPVRHFRFRKDYI